MKAETKAARQRLRAIAAIKAMSNEELQDKEFRMTLRAKKFGGMEPTSFGRLCGAELAERGLKGAKKAPKKKGRRAKGQKAVVMAAAPPHKCRDLYMEVKAAGLDGRGLEFIRAAQYLADAHRHTLDVRKGVLDMAEGLSQA